MKIKPLKLVFIVLIIVVALFIASVYAQKCFIPGIEQGCDFFYRIIFVSHP